MLMHILLRDNKNKVFQKMQMLNEETELLISENIIKINKEGYLLNINSIEFNESTTELENEGWKNDNSLYDRLINEYDRKGKGILTRWK